MKHQMLVYGYIWAVCSAITNSFFSYFSGTPLVIEGGLDNWPAINWTLESLKEKVGGNEVNVRVNTNCEEYRVGVILLFWMVVTCCQRYYTTVIVSLFQSGRQYNFKQIKFGRYIDDLIAGNARSKNSYLAVQNIKKALPQLQVNYFWSLVY